MKKLFPHCFQAIVLTPTLSGKNGEGSGYVCGGEEQAGKGSEKEFRDHNGRKQTERIEDKCGSSSSLTVNPPTYKTKIVEDKWLRTSFLINKEYQLGQILLTTLSCSRKLILPFLNFLKALNRKIVKFLLVPIESRITGRKL